VPISLAHFHIGDIVEAKATLMLVPMRGGEHKLMVILCSLTLLDATFSEVRNNLRRELEQNNSPNLKDAFVAAKSSAPKPRLAFKRTIAYDTTDKPAGRKARLDNRPEGENDEENSNNDSRMAISSE
jgi:hypothetical protein